VVRAARDPGGQSERRRLSERPGRDRHTRRGCQPPARGFPIIAPRQHRRGTEESNLEQGFWRPPCYRYTSPPETLDLQALLRCAERSQTLHACSPEGDPRSATLPRPRIPLIGALRQLPGRAVEVPDEASQAIAGDPDDDLILSCAVGRRCRSSCRATVDICCRWESIEGNELSRHRRCPRDWLAKARNEITQPWARRRRSAREVPADPSPADDL
jgi:hypothetical protein